MDIDFGNSFGNLFGSTNGFGNTPEDERELDRQPGFASNIRAFAGMELSSREDADGTSPGDAASILPGGSGWPSPSQALQQQASGPKSFADAGKVPVQGVIQGLAPGQSLQAGLLQGNGFIGAQAGSLSGRPLQMRPVLGRHRFRGINAPWWPFPRARWEPGRPAGRMMSVESVRTSEAGPVALPFRRAGR